MACSVPVFVVQHIFLDKTLGSMLVFLFLEPFLLGDCSVSFMYPFGKQRFRGYL
jgi:hypothetical protein